MKKLCLAHLGAFLLALHLFTSQVVQAQNTTDSPANVTMTMPGYTMMSNATVNTTSKENGCGRTEASALLLPLAVAASLLLHVWS